MAWHWYVVRTEPRGEYLAAGELHRDGFQVLFPRAKTPHPRTSHGDVPLFPGYLSLRRAATGEGRWIRGLGTRLLPPGEGPGHGTHIGHLSS